MLLRYVVIFPPKKCDRLGKGGAPGGVLVVAKLVGMDPPSTCAGEAFDERRAEQGSERKNLPQGRVGDALVSTNETRIKMRATKAETNALRHSPD